MARILVVDDEPMNRALLRACLSGGNHTIVDVGSGYDALVAAEEHVPDLVLLDVMMPGMDGFECVRQLRALFEGDPVPIVLVTALHDRAARVSGLAAGADEFLTKPLDREELLVRVGNLLALRARSLELQRRNVELAELRRFQDEMIAMLVHDLKSPLSVIHAGLEHLLARRDREPDERDTLTDCRQASGRISRLVGNILEIAHAEAGHLRLHLGPAAIAPIVENVLGPRRASLARLGIRIDVEVAVTANVDLDLMTRVLENLVDNAVRHTPAGGRLRVWGTTGPDHVELRIGNSGPAIPEASRAVVFEKFTQVWDARGSGSVGLGLYFCRLAIEAHGGAIWVEETSELPAVFALRLPAGRREGGD